MNKQNRNTTNSTLEVNESSGNELREVWEQHFSTNLTSVEVNEIMDSINGYFSVLQHWQESANEKDTR